MDSDTRRVIVKLFYKNGKNARAILSAFKTQRNLYEDPFVALSPKSAVLVMADCLIRRETQKRNTRRTLVFF